MAKRGRPVKGAPRKKRVQLLLTDEEYAVLQEKSEYIGVSHSDIIREGIPFGVKSLEDKMPLERKIELAELEDPELCGYYDEYCEEEDCV